MRKQWLLVTASAVLLTGGLNAQQPANYQIVVCVKAAPGKLAEYRQFVTETGKKIAETRAKAGEIVYWSLLRSVMPAGDEARCDYRIATMYEGLPPRTNDQSGLANTLEKAGLKMSAEQYLAKRNSLSRLVSMELWNPRVRLGQPQKGHYLFLNHMKVHNAAEYIKFETEVWRPMAEQWIKEGSQSGWAFSTVILPGGTDVKYPAVSADIYPTWEAVFKPRTTLKEMFQKVHAGKDYEQTVGSMGKLRDLAQRELMYIEERVTRK